MWALPGVAATVDLRDAWESYYKQLFPLNPGGLVPLLPDPERDLGLVAPP
jgi:putative glutathione S-transferase